MQYIKMPKTINSQRIRSNDFSFSAGMYRSIEDLPSSSKSVRDLLDNVTPFDKGIEPGSQWYLPQSDRYLIRTKALQSHSFLIYPKGEAIVPLNPKVFKDYQLQVGDILLSKDSNIGECVIVDSNYLSKYAFSSGIVRLHPKCNNWYLFSFLKHALFKEQLIALTARGATITHAKSLWLDCKIPFPSQSNAEDVINYVSALTQAIVDKEKEIRLKDQKTLRLIDEELNPSYNSSSRLGETNFNSIFHSGRIDAVIHTREFREKIRAILEYQHGVETPLQAGFEIGTGDSLEIKLIRTRVDSTSPKPGFYSLLLPTHISQYGTINKIIYLGTSKYLTQLKKNDVLIGEAGFQKGRSVVLIDIPENSITNAHGIFVRRKDQDVASSVFFRCIFNWYRENGLIDIIGVGGSGGHLSPSYFEEYILIPKFPETKKQEIIKLYHNPTSTPSEPVTLENFVEWHRTWNKALGVWQLDRYMKELKLQLEDVQGKIIKGQIIQIPIATR